MNITDIVSPDPFSFDQLFKDHISNQDYSEDFMRDNNENLLLQKKNCLKTFNQLSKILSQFVFTINNETFFFTYSDHKLTEKTLNWLRDNYKSDAYMLICKDIFNSSLIKSDSLDMSHFVNKYWKYLFNNTIYQKTNGDYTYVEAYNENILVKRINWPINNQGIIQIPERKIYATY